MFNTRVRMSDNLATEPKKRQGLDRSRHVDGIVGVSLAT